MQFSTVSVVALFALAKFAAAENKAAAISQITDGQIQATAGTASVAKTASASAGKTTVVTATNTVKETSTNTATLHEQSSNAAGKQVVGFGAVAVAAALLL
ncbi:similar to Saccharomyces cerevisiae YKL096W-A CWP2 Covalently linked cell wall mannoprotein, major constituent of the cell wall [Maudiozyma barnettii]|uniref:Similar to Saccharomyces cerevisiae YKL096W-A CWP2 Covalently linked cell wall mannoprotein, major constituent of the cell wall n=1 Tax=Maudiozyma barnettii TaxID=61262 RepID=A0A8H2ZIP4_9SACH|nr:Cwp2p [Kazachstania barnettii]CAB4257154.1 similar to Saccharomyces cerevisiae YKL096W-A CWP2 Covalently linked cell wall mannoprotein, major constituent of the cell wall [Kazachstania barnettii]CAD1779524.1 similar to Saccharomyces cerevisiae YKL096W-A CWP2 Covalently linked cell wall mannoprotein, major constituent of the cell wall [Kazachstania barnettii]